MLVVINDKILRFDEKLALLARHPEPGALIKEDDALFDSGSSNRL